MIIFNISRGRGPPSTNCILTQDNHSVVSLKHIQQDEIITIRRKQKMKKIFSFILAAMLTGTMALTASAAFDRTLTAPMGTPTLDGTAEALWDNAEWTTIDKPFDGSTDTTSTIKVKMLWDETNLYFLAEVYDIDIHATEDLVEIYLDEKCDRAEAYGSDDSQCRFQVSDGKLNAAVPGTQAKTDVDCAVTALGSDVYLMEGRLAWSEANAVEGAKIGLEFMYNEADSTSDFTEAYRWSVDTANGDPAPYNNTAAFGTLVLGAAPVVETVAEVVEEPTAPQTFDMGVIAAVATVVSAAGYAVSKKR